jgi:endonuclease/exonuclease/phosphatase family metal-dependent hydrolase
MGRSGNRHIPRELGRALGLDWVFANFHLVLAPGDSAERDHGVPNTQGLHGAALLSRFPIRRFAAVSLPERADKFHALEKRLGSKRALLVEVELPDGPATIVVVHLDPFASPRHRARQMRRVMQALDAFGGRRVLLGGDFNTNTYDLGTSVGLFVNVVHKLARYGFDGTVRHYMTPEHVFERRTFDVLRRAGLDIDPYTDPDRGSIYYDMTDPELIDKSLSYLPGPVVRWLERKLQPWGGIVPLRIDWFAGRGLRPVHATTIERPRYEGRRVSDHNPLVVDLEY